MPIVDLRGIHYRSYLPQFNQGDGEDEYEPVGPGDVDITPGAVDLSIIKFRAWEDADLANEVFDGDGGFGGSAGAGSPGSLGGSGASGGPGSGGGGEEEPPVDCMVPSETLYPSETEPICGEESNDIFDTITQSSTGSQSLSTQRTSEAVQNTASSSQSISDVAGIVEGSSTSGTGSQAISESTSESLGNTGTGTPAITDSEGSEAYGRDTYGSGFYGE